jgi:hypothetical protein
MFGRGGEKRLEVAASKIHNRYTSPNTIRVIKSRRINLARHVACIGVMINTYKILVDIPEIKTVIRTSGHSSEG